MVVNDERTVESVAVTEDSEPLKHQLLKEQGRRPSPVGVVYDCERNTVQVWSKKKIESENIYQTVKLPARKKRVTLFVDKETGSKFTTHSTGNEGQSNFLRTQLQLDRLSTFGQVFRILGLLSTLYVINAGSLSETASLA